MSAVALAARLLVAAVLAVAGAAKLADREGSGRAVREFGVPERFAGPLGLLLPLAELGIAAALLPGASARAAAAAAALLFLIFALAVGTMLVRGRRPDCHCFGRLHSVPVGWRVLLRNGALAGLALLVAWQPAAEPGWIEFGAGGFAALIVGQAWVALELLRRHGRALRRIEELEEGLAGPGPLEVGAEAPPFVLPDLDGGSVALESLLPESGRLVLLFSDPGCGACDRVLGEAQQEDARIVVISSGTRSEVPAKALRYGLNTVLLDDGREVSSLYGVVAVPTALLVDGDGRIAADPVVGAPEVIELIEAAGREQPDRRIEEAIDPVLAAVGAA